MDYIFSQKSRKWSYAERLGSYIAVLVKICEKLWGELEKMHSGFPDTSWALHLRDPVEDYELLVTLPCCSIQLLKSCFLLHW